MTAFVTPGMAAATAAPALHVGLYEGPGSTPLSAERRSILLSALLGRGYYVSYSGTNNGSISSSKPHLLVLGQFGAEPPVGHIDATGVAVRFHNISDQDAEVILSTVQKLEAELGATTPGTWKPWFPVIDYDRCTNCMQCLSFCLFDVYGVSKAGMLEVQQPTNCKTNCPACSRVCPEVAIVFPKYKAGPINGEPVNEDDIRREHMKVDISSLLGGDIYQALRDRSEKAKSRFSKERDSERALKERTKCLDKLKEQLDVPDEVLSSLPDLAAIAAKRSAAMKKNEFPEVTG
jgi:Pyruvate/2-oxoacid:ferredoxin oxidoreductase delta subunit